VLVLFCFVLFVYFFFFLPLVFVQLKVQRKLRIDIDRGSYDMNFLIKLRLMGVWCLFYDLNDFRFKFCDLLHFILDVIDV
jgi:hypothetical protein